MTFRTLIRRSLRFHWRSHLGVVLGAAIGSAALIGALVVGDSVKGSLRERALRQLGPVNITLDAKDRMFREDLVKRLLLWLSHHSPAGNTNAVYSGRMLAVTKLEAMATSANGEARANHLNLFVSTAGFVIPFNFLATNEASYMDENVSRLFINQALAVQLRVGQHDEILFRLPKPNALSSEITIAPRNENTVALRTSVDEIMAKEGLGDFQLGNTAITPLNAFVSREAIGEKIIPGNRATLILAEVTQYEPLRRRSLVAKKLIDWLYPIFPTIRKILEPQNQVTVQELQSALGKVWQLDDLQTELILVDSGLTLELRTQRIFLDPPIIRSALAETSNVQPILTYLATLLRAGTNATPYSMVTAAGTPWTPADLRDDEIVISQWLADDLQVKPGDEIALSYFLPESGAKLEEATNTFRVHSIVPLEMPWADRTLMPDFPGIEKAESTSEWDAGFPLTYKVRPKDDEYWRQQRGTPKAFITLAAGQKLWGNRFGNLTAIRFPIPTNNVAQASLPASSGGIPAASSEHRAGMPGEPAGKDARATTTTALTPALSPGEREKRAPVSEQSNAAYSTNSSRVVSGGETSSPLPGGEGQGEGERATQINQSEPPHVGFYKDALEKKILANLKPEELGLRFEPVREQALKAASESQDFGGLFLGFSFFLIIAALLLMAMLFQFGLEQRASEIGTLLALGFTPKQVRKVFRREGVALAFIGGIIGAVGGIYFAKAMLHGLTTVWRDAVGATNLSFHVTGQTLGIGLFASVVVSSFTLWLALRRFVKLSPRELLAGEIHPGESKVQSLKSKVIGGAALVAGLVLVGWAVMKGDTQNAGIFFGAGALVLVAGLSFVSVRLSQLAGAPSTVSARSARNHPQAEAALGAPFTAAALAVRGCARRRKRSLATVAMLACGSFLIVSIGVFRLDANRDATQKTSGTGGFALLGETTLPVVQDLNSASGRDFFALSEQDLNGVNVVPFRVRQGDEASCLNLNRAQKPRLLGVKPEALEGRFGLAKGDTWQTLRGFARESEAHINLQESQPRSHERSHEIPAIGDANSIQWAMGKKVGDTIDYVDERGQPFQVRIVGAVANSILQGQLLIDEAEFVKRFPGEAGYRMFLIDAPSNAVSQVSATLSRAMQDVGLELTPTTVRLNQFNAVQNTYLGTFQVLGGLGLLLGSVGLGIVVLRNVLERRSELAVLLAVGFRKQQVQRLLLLENGALLVAGLVIGIIAAGIAVLPALLSPAAQLPLLSLGVTLAAVLLNGALWTWAATRYAVRGDLLVALRNE